MTRARALAALGLTLTALLAPVTPAAFLMVVLVVLGARTVRLYVEVFTIE